MPDEMKRRVLMSKEVYLWPEFKLFAERAGIPLDIETRSLTITFEMDSCLVVNQTYWPKGIKGGQS